MIQNGLQIVGDEPFEDVVDIFLRRFEGIDSGVSCVKFIDASECFTDLGDVDPRVRS